MPLISVVVLNWQNAPDTLECVSSLLRCDYPNLRVLVVDNGSQDDSVQQIRTQLPEIDLLSLPENFGYAEGNNVGVRHALLSHPDYICILNNDTLVDRMMFRELVEVLDSHPEVGMVGPTMYCVEPANTLFSLGSFVNWRCGELWHRGMFESSAKCIIPIRPEPVDFIVGCGVLVRSELVADGDVFNPDYYLNYEDVEWGLRTRARGMEVWHVPQAALWHKVSATLGRTSPANTYYMTRNSLLFFWRNTPPYLRWLPITKIVFRTIKTICAWTLKSQYRVDTIRRKRDANLLALRDFGLRRFGKMGDDVARVCYGV